MILGCMKMEVNNRNKRKVDAGFYDAMHPFVKKRIGKEMVRV